jgi:hypothetical protein
MTDKIYIDPFLHFEPLPHKVINTRVSLSECNAADDINNEELVIKVDYSKK